MKKRTKTIKLSPAQTKEIKKQIREMVGKGKTKLEIASELAYLTAQQLTLLMITSPDLNQFYREQVKLEHQADQARCWELREQGLTYRRIAQELGRSETYVERLIYSHPSYTPPRQRKAKAQAMVRFLKLSGLQREAISEKLGISPETVYNYLQGK